MKLSTLLAARTLAPILCTALLAPAAVSADVFAWRTEDGVFAYTDDADRIPARYADDAVRVRDTRLGTYPRLTREDSPSANEVAARLQRRLDHLRRLNAPEVETAEAPAGGRRATLSVATGDAQTLKFDVVSGDSSEPIIVEPVLTHASNESRTRRATRVTQGDHTLAVIKSRSHHYDVNQDIYDEDDLDAGR